MSGFKLTQNNRKQVSEACTKSIANALENSSTNFQTIAVDFDGTLCYSNWPELGQPNEALISYLQEWKQAHSLDLPCR